MQTVGTTPRRYVACLDVLGFTSAIQRNLNQLCDAYSVAVKLAKRTQEAERFFPNATQTIGKPLEGRHERIHPHIFEVAVFSDSIFVFTDNESIESLVGLCEYCFLIYREFLSKGLTLRGGIAGGEAIVAPEDRIYIGQAIIDAWKLEQSLDLTGIVLKAGLACAAAVEAEVTLKCGHREHLMVPTHRDHNVDGKSQTKSFQRLRAQAGPALAKRYTNSEPVVAAMLKIDPALLRLS